MSKRRPGRFWLFFYGRRRRGFPGLLVGLLAAALLLGALFGLPHGADISRFVIGLTITALVLVIIVAIAMVVIAAIRPPRGGRRSGRR